MPQNGPGSSPRGAASSPRHARRASVFRPVQHGEALWRCTSSLLGPARDLRLCAYGLDGLQALHLAVVPAHRRLGGRLRSPPRRLVARGSR
ncbi:DUF6968 family protein [Methylobacterium currus]|uniref:DUF6968 family protein n=1 Tax=Methylobacterium currus TaxID=2051553 RepID=UPI0039C0C795